jgi:hypothetical protein
MAACASNSVMRTSKLALVAMKSFVLMAVPDRYSFCSIAFFSRSCT